MTVVNGGAQGPAGATGPQGPAGAGGAPIPNTKHDGAYTYAASISSGSHTPSAGFSGLTNGDVGKVIAIVGAGAAGAHLVTTIASVSGGVPTLTAAAGTTVSSVFAIYGTDDTAAIQAALVAGANLTPNDGIYIVNGPLVTTSSYNCQLQLPTVSAAQQQSIGIQQSGPRSWAGNVGSPNSGQVPWDGVIFFSTYVGSPANPSPSVLGAPQTQTNLNVALKLCVRTLPNPPLAHIDLGFACMCDLPALLVDTPDDAFHVTQPTHTASAGVILPNEASTNAMVTSDMIYALGTYAGVVLGEGAELGVVQCYGNAICLVPTATNHQNHIRDFWPQHSPKSIAFIGSPAASYLDIDQYDVEYNNGRLSWANIVYDIDDSGNNLLGVIKETHIVSSGSGAVFSGLTVNGANFMHVYYKGVRQQPPPNTISSFTNGWSGTGVGWWIDNDMNLCLIGFITGGTNAAAAFALPGSSNIFTNAQPSAARNAATIGLKGGTTVLPAFLQVGGTTVIPVISDTSADIVLTGVRVPLYNTTSS